VRRPPPPLACPTGRVRGAGGRRRPPPPLARPAGEGRGLGGGVRALRATGIRHIGFRPTVGLRRLCPAVAPTEVALVGPPADGRPAPTSPHPGGWACRGNPCGCTPLGLRRGRGGPWGRGKPCPYTLGLRPGCRPNGTVFVAQAVSLYLQAWRPALHFSTIGRRRRPTPGAKAPGKAGFNRHPPVSQTAGRRAGSAGPDPGGPTAGRPGASAGQSPAGAGPLLSPRRWRRSRRGCIRFLSL